MLTTEKLRKIATEAFENNEWICMVSGELFTIVKINCQEDIEDLLKNMEDCVEDEKEYVFYTTDRTLYAEADHAKDWNYFKNTMGI